MEPRYRWLCFMWNTNECDLMATERGPARRLFWRLYYIGWPKRGGGR